MKKIPCSAAHKARVDLALLDERLVLQKFRILADITHQLENGVDCAHHDQKIARVRIVRSNAPNCINSWAMQREMAQHMSQ